MGEVVPIDERVEERVCPSSDTPCSSVQAGVSSHAELSSDVDEPEEINLSLNPTFDDAKRLNKLRQILLATLIVDCPSIVDGSCQRSLMKSEK